MAYRPRLLEENIAAALQRGKSVLLLGARQTGKSTLASRFHAKLALNFAQPEVRRRYEVRPELLTNTLAALPRPEGQCPLIFFDEVQRLPICLDMAQDAIDRKTAQFILTGSSARQLRRGRPINLLPGRLVTLHLDPLMLREHQDVPLENLLHDGSLPAIADMHEARDREIDLKSYVAAYLEEEIRGEAIVRDLGRFSRFLEMAALESGNIINFSKIGEDLGVSPKLIRSYYEILEDCLVLERISPLVQSQTRKKLTKSDKYMLFDLGVRRVCASEGRRVNPERWGQLLEQWVGLELCRRVRLQSSVGCRISFWRDPGGPEIDWIIEAPGLLIPIEVKWSDAPRPRDIKHLQTFMQEYPQAKRGFVVCRTPHRLALTDAIEAISWRDLDSIWSLVPADF